MLIVTRISTIVRILTYFFSVNVRESHRPIIRKMLLLIYCIFCCPFTPSIKKNFIVQILVLNLFLCPFYLLFVWIASERIKGIFITLFYFTFYSLSKKWCKGTKNHRKKNLLDKGGFMSYKEHAKNVNIIRKRIVSKYIHTTKRI